MTFMSQDFSYYSYVNVEEFLAHTKAVLCTGWTCQQNNYTWVELHNVVGACPAVDHAPWGAMIKTILAKCISEDTTQDVWLGFMEVNL